MLGNKRGNQTRCNTGLETLRPHFWLLHASCSHFLFCLVILLPPLPARILWAFPLLSLSIYLSVQGYRGALWQEACPATTPAALHSSLSHFLPLRLLLVSFHRPPPPNLMHFSFFAPDFFCVAHTALLHLFLTLLSLLIPFPNFLHCSYTEHLNPLQLSHLLKRGRAIIICSASLVDIFT